MSEFSSDVLMEFSKWIDDTYPEHIVKGGELHARRRIDKLMEEVGEVGEALGGLYGENPRKGVTHSLHDVLEELLDVAVTALGAYESLAPNPGHTLDALDSKIISVGFRAGIVE